MARFTVDELKDRQQQLISQFIAEAERWKAFLDSASRTYKYAFLTQLLIYDQRPDATACAELPFWGNRMQRNIKRGSTGIGTIDTRHGKERVAYLFDVSDTVPRRDNIPSPYIWELRPDAQEAVLQGIERMTGEDPRLLDNFTDNLFIAAQTAAFQKAQQYSNRLDFQRAAVSSAAWCVLRRCGFDPTLYVKEIPISSLSPEEVTALGEVVQQTSETLLRSIEQTMKELDGCKLFRFTTPKRIAEQEQSVYNKSIEEIGTSPLKGADEHERTNDAAKGYGLSYRDGRQAVSRPNPSELSVVRGGTPPVHEAQRAGVLSGNGSSWDAERVSQRRGDARTRGTGSDHVVHGEAGRDGRRAESHRSAEIDRPDEQLPSLRSGDRARGLGVQLTEPHTEKAAVRKASAAFPFNAEPVPEQLSLLSDEFTKQAGHNVFHRNTQEKTTQAAAATSQNVFHRNTSQSSLPGRYDISQAEIDHVLRMGGNTDRQRECIVAAFEEQKSTIEIAAYLQTLYHGGNGFDTENGKFVAWYDNDGIHLSRGQTVRFDRSASVISWQNAAERIGQLLQDGHFATNVELAEAEGYERSLLAEQLWHLYHDFNDEARDSGYLSCLSNIQRTGFPAETEWLADQLNSPEFRHTLAEEYAAFRTAYQQNRDLLRFPYHRLDEMLSNLRDLDLPRQAFSSELTEIPAIKQFITIDEINDAMAGGSGVSGGKGRIFDYFQQPHTAKEKVDFLKEEYGIGGHGSNEWHDGKGVRYKKRDCPDVKLTWDKAAAIITDLIHDGRYFSEQEQAEYQKIQEEKAPAEASDYHIIGDFPDQTAQAQVNPPNPAEVPYVICDWSESPIFEDGKQYSIYEFDTLMKQADDERVAGKNAALKKYGTWEAWYDADDPELTRFLGYDKTQFTIVMPDGRTFTERQDIGDGDGGLLDFLNQYPNYRNILPILRQAALREQHADDPAHDVFQRNTLEESIQAAATDPVRDVFQGNTLEESVQAAATDPARDVFQGNTLEESVQSAATDPARDVFQGNTLEESAQSAAADPAHDVFQGNTLEESAQDATDMENTPYPSRETAPSNFRIMDDNLGVGGPKEKFWRNIKAIATLKQIEQEERYATPEEQQLLSQYVGWGGLSDAFDQNKPAWAAEYSELKGLLTPEEYAAARGSTLNAHYTSPTVIRAIYDAVNRMGFENGTILEPSCGVGNFFGMLPESMSGSKLYGVELDSISGRIAQQLYPNASITVDGFEHTQFADNSFDLAIGNVPFGDYKLADSRYDKDNLLIHDYFFVKTLDKVKPNGVIAFITSKGTMDKKDTHVRRLLAQKADLLGAIRLPNNAFKANAGAEVTTDIIFLQKRETPPEHDPEWVQLGQNQDGLLMNSYFISHPEMILGEMKMESTQYGYDTACVSRKGEELTQLLSEAVQHLDLPAKLPTQDAENVFRSNTLHLDASDSSTEEVNDYSFFVKNGMLLYHEPGVDLPAMLNNTAEQRARAMIDIRQSVRTLIKEQTEGCDDARLHALQSDLNRLYDAFIKKYGYIRSYANRLAFSKDAGYPLLLALEDLDDEQNVKGKSAIFTQRTIRPHIAISHADTPQDALGLSLAEYGKIDFDYMSGLLDGMAQDKIISALHGQIFRDPPSGHWQPADEYLSGNVREKLRIAKEYAEKDPTFSVNVKMLESVQPEPLTAADISVRLGTTWIPPEDITQFVREVLYPPFHASDKITVSYSDAVKRWYVANKSYDKDRNSPAYTKYGTNRVNGYELLELSLNLRDVQIFDVEIVDGQEKRIPNHQETIKARNKQDALRQAFKDWIYADPNRRARLVDYYNEHFNHTRPRTFNGDYLSFPGMNPNINMRKHQRDAVARILYGGNTLLAHCVGAGKTWTMAAGAM